MFAGSVHLLHLDKLKYKNNKKDTKKLKRGAWAKGEKSGQTISK